MQRGHGHVALDHLFYGLVDDARLVDVPALHHPVGGHAHLVGGLQHTVVGIDQPLGQFGDGLSGVDRPGRLVNGLGPARPVA